MHKVIINSDDFGYSCGINYGIVDAYLKGILTSTTIMANMPGFDHAVELKKENPDLGVGVHLTLTCGKPLLDDVPSLIQVNGDFHKLSFYKQDFSIDQDELYREWDTQIQKVYEAGIEPTHLDSHHHTHTIGINQDVVVNLAKKYSLPVRRNFEKNALVKTTSYFEENFDIIGDPKNIEGNLDVYLDNLVKKLKAYESTEIMCHAGYIDKAILNGSSFIFPRAYQTDFLINSSFAKKLLNDASIQLVHYGAI
ncbi:carbohydrate deacetylase [Virgibacillus sp. SK37]|uniref:carbohydrate deacetylase n=1 Tax=Virgibacillus sp. SK37 TaxID=403957 RepID=UPI0011A3BE5B|nr:carbohydrate deacetylase [Virgibacillus sp. SK37]